MLAQLNAMLQNHTRLDRSSAYVRFVELGDIALELEMQAYVLTVDYNDFAAVREQILLKVMEIVAGCGTAMAFPSQTIYVAKDLIETAAPVGKPAEK